MALLGSYHATQEAASQQPPPLALRPREACRALSISPATLDRLTRAGAIPVVKAGRVRLYMVADLEQFLTSRRSGGGVA